MTQKASRKKIGVGWLEGRRCGLTWPRASRTRASQGMGLRALKVGHWCLISTGFGFHRTQGWSSIRRRRRDVKEDRKRKCPGPHVKTRGDMLTFYSLSLRQDGQQPGYPPLRVRWPEDTGVHCFGLPQLPQLRPFLLCPWGRGTSQ